MKNLKTETTPTWCPGCFNYQVMAGVKMALKTQLRKKKKKDFAIITGIGCHGKIFDYLNLNGLNTLHGRVAPTCLGLKVGNPNLNVIGFSGDGDSYAEGISHLIHAARYNSNYKLVVHNNQVFALTVGQPTPTTELGIKDKTTPFGNKNPPLNPIKLMLSSNASFIARVFADPNQIKKVLNQALEHKGFAFIEILQPCIIFHNDSNYKNKLYDLQKSEHNKTNWNKAMERAKEFEYDKVYENTKIPLGIFYQKERETLEEKYKQLRKKMKK